MKQLTQYERRAGRTAKGDRHLGQKKDDRLSADWAGRCLEWISERLRRPENETRTDERWLLEHAAAGRGRGALAE
ncbi:MAG: hypothetical protein R6U98_36985 [Pirellulaceae bacterium]